VKDVVRKRFAIAEDIDKEIDKILDSRQKT
jgi:hypothetical protein